MVPRSHALLLVLVAVVALSAGCLGAGPFGDGGESTPTLTPAPVPTAEPSTPTAQPAAMATETPRQTAPSWEQAADEPDPSKGIYVENDWDRTVTFDVRVVRDRTNRTVYDGRHTLEPGARQRVYDTTAADPDGIEPFTAVVTARNATQRVTIETNECYGSAHAVVTDEGSLETFYAIC